MIHPALTIYEHTYSMRLKTAKRVLEQESRALKELASFLSDSFNQALDIIRQISGRIICNRNG